MKPTDYSYLLTNYLGKYLLGTLGLSPNTISSYRDMFTLMITFYETAIDIKPEKITLKDLPNIEWKNLLNGSNKIVATLSLPEMYDWLQFMPMQNIFQGFFPISCMKC